MHRQIGLPVLTMHFIKARAITARITKAKVINTPSPSVWMGRKNKGLNEKDFRQK
jgi:hypothetical protein